MTNDYEVELYGNSGNVPVATAAKVLNVDSQTVRLLLQQNLVPWGMAYKLPGSSKYSYMIYSNKFYEYTGFNYFKGGVLCK